MCAQPPAGLRPGLPLFSRKMDGFTGSLGESQPPLTPRRSPGHLSVQRRDVESRTRLWRLYTCHCCIYQKESAPPLRRLQGHKTNSSS